MPKLTRSQKYAELREKLANDAEASASTPQLSEYNNKLKSVEEQLTQVFTKEEPSSPSPVAAEVQPAEIKEAAPVTETIETVVEETVPAEQTVTEVPEVIETVKEVEEVSSDPVSVFDDILSMLDVESAEETVPAVEETVEETVETAAVTETEEETLDDLLSSIDSFIGNETEENHVEDVPAEEAPEETPVKEETPVETPVVEETVEEEKDHPIEIEDVDAYLMATLAEVSKYNQKEGHETVSERTASIINEVRNHVDPVTVEEVPAVEETVEEDVVSQTTEITLEELGIDTSSEADNKLYDEIVAETKDDELDGIHVPESVKIFGEYNREADEEEAANEKVSQTTEITLEEMGIDASIYEDVNAAAKENSSESTSAFIEEVKERVEETASVSAEETPSSEEDPAFDAVIESLFAATAADELIAAATEETVTETEETEEPAVDETAEETPSETVAETAVEEVVEETVEEIAEETAPVEEAAPVEETVEETVSVEEDEEFSNTVSLEIEKIMSELNKPEEPETLDPITLMGVVDTNENALDLDWMNPYSTETPEVEEEGEEVNEHPVLAKALEVEEEEPVEETDVVEIKNLRDLEAEEKIQQTISHTIPFVVNKEEAEEVDYDEDDSAPNKILNIILGILIVILLAVLGFIVYYIAVAKGLIG